MALSLDDKLVIATSSSALFDTRESHQIWIEQGAEAYREYQRANENVPLGKGPAFTFIERLLRLNDAGAAPVEVILLSRNSADTGLRAMNTIAHYGLPITRAAFTNGRSPFGYSRAFRAVLYLSTEQEDVMRAIQAGLPGGLIMGTHVEPDVKDDELRIAFDFDGILADDSAERVYQQEGLQAFQQHEKDHVAEPLGKGPLAGLLEKIATLQRKELEKKKQAPSYRLRLRTAIVTSRNAPAHARAILTLRTWGINVDEVFFLGGLEKKDVLAEFKPHIFFDDQRDWAESAAQISASVHVPFGVINEQLNAALAKLNGGV